ncbi:MAG: TrbG/VirB9 family P-type conjugative transfer protein [Methylotenera sp.]
MKLAINHAAINLVRTKLTLNVITRVVLTSLSITGYAQANAQVNESLANPVQLVPYDTSQATMIKAKRGFATHIDLEADEHIVKDGVGGGDTDNWITSAKAGSNFILLKPKKNAHDSNLVVKTDRRSYAFDLRVLKDHSPDKGTWRIAYTYPKSNTEVAPLTSAQIEAINKAKVKQLQDAPQTIRNTQYSMQAMPNSGEIAPTAAWDDGNFTYLKIPSHREIPAVFRVTADGAESMVNIHMEGDNKDTIVIHGMAKHYVLRLSKQVVGVWNDAYDIEGVSPNNGTVTLGVSRKVTE